MPAPPPEPRRPRAPRPPTTPVVGYLLLAPPPTAADWPALLDALGAHSPAIEPDPPDGCWLDLRPGRRGPSIESIGAALLATASEWGHAAARLGVAPTPGVARLAAWHGPAPATLLAPPAVAPFLAPLPVAATGSAAALVDRLALLGLHTLGDLAQLPPGALGDHLGPPGPPLEALARGLDDRSLVPARPPLVLVARRDLDWPLDDHAQLAALLAHLLAPLIAGLRRQGLGATRATLTRTYAGRRRDRDEAIAVPLGQPTVDVDHIRRLLLVAWPAAADREADDAAPPPALTALAVALAAPRPLAGRQASFFDVPTGQQARLAAGIAETGRRANGELGYLRPLDPAHPLPERRYGLLPAEEIARLEAQHHAEDV